MTNKLDIAARIIAEDIAAANIFCAEMEIEEGTENIDKKDYGVCVETVEVYIEQLSIADLVLEQLKEVQAQLAAKG